MNKEELIKKLNALNVPNNLYCLDGGLPNEAMCVEKNGRIWEVYYSERGSKTGLVTFDSVEDAYSHLYYILKEEAAKNYF